MSSGADRGCTGGVGFVLAGKCMTGGPAPRKVNAMATRTTQTVVHFASPFLLPCLDAPEPAGDYRVEHDEESIEGAAWFAWRRVNSFIHLPALGSNGSTHQMVPVDPTDLDAALEKDQRL